MTTVLIVEDDPMIAEDLFGIVKKLGFDPYEPCYSKEEALQFLNGHKKPSIVLLDINLDGEESGIEIGRRLNEQLHTPFIYVTSYSDTATVKTASKTQPLGYIVKPFTSASVYSAIEIALENHSQKNKNNLVSFSLEKINKSLPTPLTDREFELLQLINDGSNNTEISDKLFVSINTTKKHLKNIFAKLDVTSRTAAIAAARKLMEA
ncbi:MAG: response regulator transcription factor [Ferruginibacter sp.]|nr:response regulator transcription factor [Ferruginibacter sp.]